MTSNIKKVYAAYIEIPLKNPFVTALRKVTKAKDLVLVLESTCGKKGYGSATATKKITGEDLETIKSCLKHQLLPCVLEKTFKFMPDPKVLSDFIHAAVDGMSSAKCLIEVAYCDLYAKIHGKTLSQFFKTNRTEFTTSYTISLDNPEKMALQARQAIDCDFKSLKIKLGHKNIAEDIKAFSLINNSTGKDIRFKIDANQAWTSSNAIDFLDEIDKSKVVLLEQPLEKNNFDGIRKLKMATTIPIFADESAFNSKELKKLIESSCCDGVVIKLLKTGGFYEAIRMIDLAKKFQKKIMISSMLETKLGVYHALIVAGLTPVDSHIDLDASFLQSKVPFEYGFKQTGPEIAIDNENIDIFEYLEKTGSLETIFQVPAE